MQTQIQTRQYNPKILQQWIEQGKDPLLSRLFLARGAQSYIEFSHEFKQLTHFENIKNIQAATQRLTQAIQQQEHIIIIADYDADGATACALAILALRQMGAKVDFLVPNRFEHGYGLCVSLVEQAQKMGGQLLLTVDNGIAAHQGIAHAQKLEMDVLVTDHHLPAATLPDCLIVNPNQPDCPFVEKATAGVGVMFYVLLALRSHLRSIKHFNAQLPEPNLADHLDLVALGTVADVVPLTHNNRILVAQGIERIKKGKINLGIRALFQAASRDYRRAGVFDLGFAIAPRLNAAGRLDDMSLGIRCLLATDENEANSLAEELNTLNQTRQSIEKNMIDQALTLPELHIGEHENSICLFQEGWHEGVIGIVAGRMREQFYRPSIIFAQAEDGCLKGSGRSVDGLHLRDALDWIDKQHPELIIKFGGHAMAAGLSIEKKYFNDFQAAFEKAVSHLLPEEKKHKTHLTDGSLHGQEITLSTAQKLHKQVWGQSFSPPTFVDQFTLIHQKTVGSHHQKLILEKDNYRFEAMIFRCQEILPKHITAVYRPVVNFWRNQEELQIYIDHWQAA